MAKQVWHIDCYNKQTGKLSNARGQARWFAVCNICGKEIIFGQDITWSTQSRGELPDGREQPPPPPPTIQQTVMVASPTQIQQPLPVKPRALPSIGSGKDAMDNLAIGLVPYLEQYLNVQLPDADQFIADLKDKLSAGMDNTVEQLVKKYATIVHRHEIEIRQPELGESKHIGVQHKLFPTLLRAMQARKHHDNTRLNIWLAGPAGSGKTSAAKMAAKALGLPFGFCGALDAKYDLSGFINAHGQCVHTDFRDKYINGGVFLLDELDSWNPAAQLWLNAALANTECAFPDGTHERNMNFSCIGAANTWGLGGDNDYVGRTKLDAAFLDRFTVKLDWQYDEDLELALTPCVEWTRMIQGMRANAKRYGIKTIISPRKSIDGYALLQVGFTTEEALAITVFAGLSADNVKLLRETN